MRPNRIFRSRARVPAPTIFSAMVGFRLARLFVVSVGIGAGALSWVGCGMTSPYPTAFHVVDGGLPQKMFNGAVVSPRDRPETLGAVRREPDGE